MITEDFVSFETAKLLKEKGFDVPCLTCWYIGSEAHEKFNDSPFNYNEIKSEFEWLSRPTLQMAMKWLREVHKIHIQIWILEEKGYWFDIEKILNDQYKHKSLYSTGLEDIYFETYEQACEAAIKCCLENLI